MSTIEESSGGKPLGSAKAGPVLLTGLGMAYLCVGGYVSWGLAVGSGGTGGALAAFGLVWLAFLLLCLCLSELATMMPSAGGGFEYVSKALGPRWGHVAAAAIMLEYACGSAALAAYCGGYIGQWAGTDGFIAVCALVAVVTVLHMRGVGDVLTVTLIVTLFALAGVGLFLFHLAPHFSMARLTDIAPRAGHNLWFPHGFKGAWAAVPFVVTFFITIEGLAFASEEVALPEKNVPRAMFSTLGLAGLLALALLIVGPGAVGADVLSRAADPITIGLQVYAGAAHGAWIRALVTLAGITALVAAFFGGMFGTSRLMYHLAREGLMPQTLGWTNRRGAPWVAILVIAAGGLVLAKAVATERLLVIFVFGATVSYLLIFAAHARLRRVEPLRHRPYRSPGGAWVSWFGLVLAAAIFVACFIADVNGSWFSLAVLCVLGLAFAVNVGRSNRRAGWRAAS